MRHQTLKQENKFFLHIHIKLAFVLHIR